VRIVGEDRLMGQRGIVIQIRAWRLAVRPGGRLVLDNGATNLRGGRRRVLVDLVNRLIRFGSSGCQRMQGG